MLDIAGMPDLMTTRSVSVTDLGREAERGALYAVLDACDEPSVPLRVAELGPALAVSLYRPPAEQELAAIAPYLVRLLPTTLLWLAETLWTDPWGIFAVSDADIQVVRAHFRKCLLVDGPDGDTWYFRFYDPRVLAKFLPTCDAPQLTEFFGPVSAYGVTDLETYGVTLVTRRWLETPTPSKPRVTVRRQ